MSLTDPIGDLLTCLRNASRAGKPQVDVPASKLGAAVVDCLKREGFVQNWRRLEGDNPQGLLRVYLKYTPARKPILRHLRRVSKPGLRVYLPRNKVRRVLSGAGVSVLTTSEGVVTDAEARSRGIGGEVICEVW